MKPILTFLLILCAHRASAVEKTAAKPPNIIIFLADDLGYADIGVNGCKDIPTPHIDSIAKNGMRFTDGYATHCVCSPSRAGLMSGLYQHRFGFEHNSGPERFADPNFGQPRSVPTLAEKLRPLGYATGMVGKWHIGFKEGLRPHERGFDSHFGFLSGAHSYLPGRRDNDPIVRNGVAVMENEYLTDAFAREAVSFLDGTKGRPFFLHVAFNAVHSPMDESKYMERFPNLTGKRRTFAGMLAALDDAVGRVLAKVRALGQEDNTLVFFYSDNGGPTAETTSRNDPLRGFKGQFYEGGIRVPFLMQWKSRVTAGGTYTRPVMAFDIHATALAAAKVAGASAPADAAKAAATLENTLDGVNLLPFLTDEKSGPPHAQLFWRAGATHAVRAGDWKLVVERAAGVQLFHLKDDLGEQTNLAAKEPAKLAELTAAFAAWEKHMMPAHWVRQDARNAEAGGKKKSSAAAPAPARPSSPAAGRGMAQVESAFKAADKSNDGRLTREEYPQPGIFKDVDANNDGFATLEEVRAYYAKRRAQPAPATPHPQPEPKP